MHHKRVTIGILAFWILLGLFHSPVHAAKEPFPLYPVIDPNVTFWTNIYARYSTTQAVVHDSVHLDIVYEVIELKPANHRGARKINRQRMKKAGQRVEQILKRLAADPLAEDADCRRVAALFGPGANARTFSHARHRVRCQIGQRDRFQAGLVRSGAYIDRIRAILTANGVPEDLAYLPHVESSFNTNAYSKFGAAGMWQFTRSTGKRFMTVDYVLDERRDPLPPPRRRQNCSRKTTIGWAAGRWPLLHTTMVPLACSGPRPPTAIIPKFSNPTKAEPLSSLREIFIPNFWLPVGWHPITSAISAPWSLNPPFDQGR
jgi:membrane-bound lytic murein transglycosylase D